MQGFITTLRLRIWTTIFATFIEASLGLFRVSVSLLHRLIGGTYLELVRNFSPFVIIFIFYFFVGDQILAALAVGEFTLPKPPGKWPAG